MVDEVKRQRVAVQRTVGRWAHNKVFAVFSRWREMVGAKSMHDEMRVLSRSEMDELKHRADSERVLRMQAYIYTHAH